MQKLACGLLGCGLLCTAWLLAFSVQVDCVQAVPVIRLAEGQTEPLVKRLSKSDYIPPPPIEEPPKAEPVTVAFDVPEIDTSFKSYTDYRLITSRSSPQWQVRENSFTDQDGMRRVEYPDGSLDYVVALGSAYSRTVGDRFIITLESGNRLTATVGDLKQDRHTDETHRYMVSTGNVAEFYIDTQAVNSRVLQMGDVSVVEGLEGRIVKLEKIVGEE